MFLPLEDRAFFGDTRACGYWGLVNIVLTNEKNNTWQTIAQLCTKFGAIELLALTAFLHQIPALLRTCIRGRWRSRSRWFAGFG